MPLIPFVISDGANFARTHGAGRGLRMYGGTSGYVGLAPAATITSYDLTLPNADGSNGQSMRTDGAGALSWFTPGDVVKAGLSGQTSLAGDVASAATFIIYSTAHGTKGLIEFNVTGRAHVTAAGGFGDLGGQATSCVFGDNAQVSSTSGTAFGYAADGGLASVAMGFGASTASATSSVSIGYATNAAGRTGSVALGRQSTCTGNNQFVCGSTGQAINDVYFGKGVTHATPTAYTIHGTGGSGTDIVGGGVTIAGGQGNGAGNGGSVILKVAPNVAGPSATPNTLVNAIEIDASTTATKMGFFAATPVVKPTALTTEDAGAVDSGDATTDGVIENIRTRLGELEDKLQGLGLLT